VSILPYDYDWDGEDYVDMNGDDTIDIQWQETELTEEEN
jgi:hypothetical protein